MTVFGKKMSKMNYFVRLLPRPLTRAKDFVVASSRITHPSIPSIVERGEEKFGREIYSRIKRKAVKSSFQLFDIYIYRSAGIWIIFHSSVSLFSASYNTRFTILGTNARVRDFADDG